LIGLPIIWSKCFKNVVLGIVENVSLVCNGPANNNQKKKNEKKKEGKNEMWKTV
jgi:hypothetical protein